MCFNLICIFSLYNFIVKKYAKLLVRQRQNRFFPWQRAILPSHITLSYPQKLASLLMQNFHGNILSLQKQNVFSHVFFKYMGKTFYLRNKVYHTILDKGKLNVSIKTGTVTPMFWPQP